MNGFRLLYPYLKVTGKKVCVCPKLSLAAEEPVKLFVTVQLLIGPGKVSDCFEEWSNHHPKINPNKKMTPPVKH